MNVYEYAMKVEKEGEAYYREMAAAATNAGLKRIFTMLADEEVKHYNVFKNMMKKEDMDLEELDLITDTQTIFQTLNEEKDNVTFDADQIKFYKDAIAREEDSHDFYAEKAAELDNEKQKKIFLHVAKEEIKHKQILEEIVAFLEEPADWVASAEF
ncbi:ferritin family protein [Arcobacter sp. LA11]|uniref:ferritin-like domain-containing protein n=1 Tax=Arcobacter sp. LA11 TaxID=1898176 RepID=UPI0009338AFD|nr:ferritin family protein [Arcobacter sp. LA11]